MWCHVMWCDVMWYDVMWCDMIYVLYCTVLYCTVLYRAFHNVSISFKAETWDQLYEAWIKLSIDKIMLSIVEFICWIMAMPACTNNLWLHKLLLTCRCGQEASNVGSSSSGSKSGLSDGGSVRNMLTATLTMRIPNLV